MATVRGLTGRLLSRRPDRDGEAPALQTAALGANAALAGLPPFAAATPRRRLASSEAQLIDALSQKVLGGWIQNRHQTLYPLTMNFRTLPVAAAELLIAVAAAALHAGGAPGPADIDRAQAWLRTAGATDDQRASLTQALTRSRVLHELLAETLAARLGPQAYAVALAVLDQRPRINRMFLDYLAARLAIPADVARSLAQRYRL